MNVVERMPTTRGYDKLRESVYALLGLSDLVCERAGLVRYQAGSPLGAKTLPAELAEAGSALRRIVRFSPEELHSRGIPIDPLAAFGFMPASEVVSSKRASRIPRWNGTQSRDGTVKSSCYCRPP